MIRRRRFLQNTTLAASAGLPIAALARHARGQSAMGLVPDPEGHLDLREGFSYRVLQRRGDPMTDGFPTPGKVDGMTCLPGPDGTWILLRNHEVNPTHADVDRAVPLGGEAPENTYDPAEGGGVSRVVVDAETLEVVSSNLVLFGTFMNCAGGDSPWGWLSCEEIDDARENLPLEAPEPRHGFVFLCRPDVESLAPAEPIRGYGRYRHEAAVVNPDTLVCYLTEDRNDSCFYRFVPKSAETPFEGVLQALKVVGRDNFQTSAESHRDMLLDVEWVDVDDPEALQTPTRYQAQSKGAAVFVRGEGIAADEGRIYVCSTTGGPAGAGQIFRYTESPSPDPLDPRRRGQLELLYQSEHPDDLDSPDNIVVAPWGDVLMCEDNIAGDQYLKILTVDGRIEDFAHNVSTTSELAGICFSPDGKVLFANLQHDGITLAITGPFPRASSRRIATASGVPSNTADAAGAGLDVPYPDGLRLRGGLGCGHALSPGPTPLAATAAVAAAVSMAARRAAPSKKEGTED